MIEAVLFSRDEIIAQFGVSRRLAMRLGALLVKKVAVSAIVLEEAATGGALEKVILDKSLLENSDISFVLERLLSKDVFADIAEEFPLRVVEQDGYSVIASKEELLAEEGFASLGKSAPTAPLTLLPLVSARTHDPIGGGGQGVSAFSAEEVSRLRVDIFAGATSAEKVAALRKLAYVDIEQPEKAKIFLQAAVDEDAELRSAAAQGLKLLGVEIEICEAARMLAEGDSGERRAAADRLLDRSHGASASGLDAILCSFIGAVRDQKTSEDDLRYILSVAAGAVSEFGPERLCREDVLRVLLELVTRAEEATLLVLRNLLAVIDRCGKGFVRDYLFGEISATGNHGYRASLLEQVTALEIPEERVPEVLDLVARTVANIPTDSGTSHILGNFLIRCGDEGVRSISELLRTADVPHQRFFLRLLDNALRGSELDSDVRLAAAAATLGVLRRCPRQVRADILETRICCDDNLPEALRASAAEALLQDLKDYVEPPLSGIMSGALVRLGKPAIGALLTALEEHRLSVEAKTVAEALGELGFVLAETGAESGVEAANGILRQLQKMSFADLPCRGGLFLAMGRICSSEAIQAAAGSVIIRNLFSRLDGNELDANVIEALGMACAGQGADDNDRSRVFSIVREKLTSQLPDVGMEQGTVDGEEVFTVDASVDVYSEMIPGCLAAFESLALSSRTSADLRLGIVEMLLERWGKVITLDVMWGPANVTRLTGALGHIGMSPLIESEARIRICNSLARKVSEIRVIEALAGILSCGDDSPQLDRLCGSLLLRILSLLDEQKDMSRDDRETYLRLLAETAMRGSFEIRGGGIDRLCKRVGDALLRGMRAGVNGCYRSLQEIEVSEKVPQALREMVAGELADFTGLARR